MSLYYTFLAKPFSPFCLATDIVAFLSLNNFMMTFTMNGWIIFWFLLCCINNTLTVTICTEMFILKPKSLTSRKRKCVSVKMFVYVFIYIYMYIWREGGRERIKARAQCNIRVVVLAFVFLSLQMVCGGHKRTLQICMWPHRILLQALYSRKQVTNVQQSAIVHYDFFLYDYTLIL